jgi:ElaB/YqjD/DUF883 family membrane-anchored ribosome-binding protein
MPETQDKAREVAGQAQDKAREVVGQAPDRAREAAGQARGRVSQEVDRRSSQAGEQVSSNASDARSVADELRKQGRDAPARYVEQAADRAERIGGYLQQSDGDRILRDVEDFARRNPWAVAAGGLLVGFAASRMLKASSGDRYRSSLSTQSNGAAGVNPGAAVGHGTRASQFEPHA